MCGDLQPKEASSLSEPQKQQSVQSAISSSLSSSEPQCDKCQQPAAYTRKYSGQTLCVSCFKDSIARKVAKTISKYDMIQNEERVAVAVSGGKDSLALLQIMHEMSQRHNFEISVITVDEGIPGYRNEALGIVSRVCGEMGLPHKVYAYSDLFDVTLDEALQIRSQQPRAPKTQMLSSCSICGTLRRRAIDIAARDVGADVIATGHNLDDMLQTFLINMLSGDTDKIAWMSPGGAARRRGGGGDDDDSSSVRCNSGNSGPRRIKPFCEIYESEIVYYAFASNLPFQEEPCPHMNEGIRTDIREFLNSLESERSGIKNSMYASVVRMIQMAHDAAVADTDTNTIAPPLSAPYTPPSTDHNNSTPFVKYDARHRGSKTATITPSHATKTIPAGRSASVASVRPFLGDNRPITPNKQSTPCVRCGADCTGDDVCSVCGIMAGLGIMDAKPARRDTATTKP